MVGPAAKRAVVKDLVQRGVCSERRACGLLDAPRMTVRYPRRIRSDEAALRKRIRALANKHKRFGVRRIFDRLKREGWRVNKKRVHRLWKDEGLQRAQKTKRKRGCGPSLELPMRAEYPNHVWSYDFIEDRTERGGKLRMLCVLDEFTRQCWQIRVERSIGAAKVIASLEWLFLLHGMPTYIRSDNGPELIAKALQKWLAERERRAGADAFALERLMPALTLPPLGLRVVGRGAYMGHAAHADEFLKIRGDCCR